MSLSCFFLFPMTQEIWATHASTFFKLRNRMAYILGTSYYGPAMWIFCWNARTKFDKLLKLQDQASFVDLWVTSYSVGQLCFKNTATIKILDIIKHVNYLLLVFKENQTTIFCLFNQLSQGKNISSWVYKALLLFIRKFPLLFLPFINIDIP